MIEIHIFWQKLTAECTEGAEFFLSVLCTLPSAMLRRPRLNLMFGSGKSRVR